MLLLCPKNGGEFVYLVSESFLHAVQVNTRKYHWTEKITTTLSMVYSFDENDIIKGSSYISAQYYGSGKIELGYSVFF